MDGLDRKTITIHADGQAVAPQWAVLQRQLIDAASDAAIPFVEKYTRDDGTLIWRDEWPGMDGSDDPYEGFTSFPLLYALGGPEHLLQLAHRQWEAITKQFTQYGQIHNEFDAYYDWMHHGEGYLGFYYFGLADPGVSQDRDRAIRFAGMYTGEDAEAQNWDPVRKLIRSPLNGSRGPRLQTTAEDWCTHREIYDDYLAPFEDIPGYVTAGDPLTRLAWSDDAIFAEILKLVNRRMTRGDVPLNLASTSLVTNAFLYTSEDKYRQWVLEYYDAWKRRTELNGGIMPDNVGLSGEIGEHMDGKWWGGYYGWRWSHGWRTILEATLIAAANAVLLTGDLSHLDLPRSQLDLVWEQGRVEDGVFQIPHRYGDGGWFDYRPPSPRFHIFLYHVSQSPQDLERLQRFQDQHEWAAVQRRFGKAPIQYSSSSWFAYLAGQNPGYPESSLSVTLEAIARRMEAIAGDDLDDAPSWNVHHWQKRDPVMVGPLAQQTMGADWLYHGGLIQARVRYFDLGRRRPGLPDKVGALVEEMAPESVRLRLVNSDAGEGKDVLIQAGAFAEHRFVDVRPQGGSSPPVPIDGRVVQVHLDPGAQADLQIGMKRFANTPTYDFPWDRTEG
jgi:hypothetical protein